MKNLLSGLNSILNRFESVLFCFESGPLPGKNPTFPPKARLALSGQSRLPQTTTQTRKMAHRAESILRHLAPQETKAQEASGKAQIDRTRLKQLLDKEEKMFLERHPKRYAVTLTNLLNIANGLATVFLWPVRAPGPCPHVSLLFHLSATFGVSIRNIFTKDGRDFFPNRLDASPDSNFRFFRCRGFCVADSFFSAVSQPRAF
jgi:hypothetical protein